MQGLINISKERIIDELFKILKLKNFGNLFKNEFTSFIFLSIFPQLKYYNRLNLINKISNNISNRLNSNLLLSILLIDNSDNSEFFLYKYNLSNKNKKRILFLQNNFRKNFIIGKLSEKELLRLMYLNGKKAAKDLLIFSIFVNSNVDLNIIEKQINFVENSEIPIVQPTVGSLSIKVMFLD